MWRRELGVNRAGTRPAQIYAPKTEGGGCHLADHPISLPIPFLVGWKEKTVS